MDYDWESWEDDWDYDMDYDWDSWEDDWDYDWDTEYCDEWQWEECSDMWWRNACAVEMEEGSDDCGYIYSGADGSEFFVSCQEFSDWEECWV